MTMNSLTQTSAPNMTLATSVSPLEQSGSTNTKFSKKKAKTDIYQTVTDSIIGALESGVKPWGCPWVRQGQVSGLPSNLTTGNAYNGINIMLLWCSAAKQGFNDSRWLTYKQAQELGAQVRRGEQGTTAIYYKTLEKENEQGDIDKIPMIKSFVVFNVNQIDGLNLDVEALPETTFDPLPDVEALIARSGAKINEQGAQAFYNPSIDEIWLPERQRFAEAASFYATGLHELVHWTGAKTRLNREKGGKFGSEGYAFMVRKFD